MLKQGEFVIVQDADRGDRYCAQAVKDEADEAKIHPLVRVLYLLRYPIQHAILWPDVPNENPPLACGALARLAFVRRCARGEETLFGYEGAFCAALTAAYARTGSAAERAILHRHREGRFEKRRIEISQ
jgi:hypothetical protein